MYLRQKFLNLYEKGLFLFIYKIWETCKQAKFLLDYFVITNQVHNTETIILISRIFIYSSIHS